MRTSIGKYLSKLRISRGETLKDMAVKLGVSSAFLSAVENGKKKTPETWEVKLKNLYSLTDKQVIDFRTAIIESSDIIELDVSNVSSDSHRLAVTFARYFETLDADTAKKIIDVLNKQSED